METETTKESCKDTKCPYYGFTIASEYKYKCLYGEPEAMKQVEKERRAKVCVIAEKSKI